MLLLRATLVRGGSSEATVNLSKRDEGFGTVRRCGARGCGNNSEAGGRFRRRASGPHVFGLPLRVPGPTVCVLFVPVGWVCDCVRMGFVCARCRQRRWCRCCNAVAPIESCSPAYPYLPHFHPSCVFWHSSSGVSRNQTRRSTTYIHIHYSSKVCERRKM